MYYVRFLKPPRIERASSGCFFIKAVITITTDLGDRFYPLDTKLLVLVAANGDSQDEEFVSWKANTRALPVAARVSKTHRSDIVLVVSPTTRTKTDVRGSQLRMPPILGAISSTIDDVSPGAEAAKAWTREFPFAESSRPSIVEDFGDSMTNHVWDSSVCLAVGLEHLIRGRLDDSLPTLKQLLQSEPSNGLRIIELGCGCGVVGVTLSCALEKCDVILTDLPEAERVAWRNVRRGGALPTHSKANQPVRFEQLDWAAEELPASVKVAPFDLVVAADVTYNTDSMSIFIATLSKLSDLSNGMPIVIATKTRHPSEAIFFELMEKEEFIIKEKCTISAPTTDENVAEVEDPEQIDVYVFQRPR
ncbi:MAG: hypothetical protein M1831_006750 [Alyxoria varia]|nr:MAG: hypothetical protein M1831_006750 [Alyxoria varia]